jgi:hypothetical protein
VIALGEALEASALDGRMMDETILAPVLRRDESKALAVVEPLHFTRVPHAVLFSLSLSLATKQKET